MVWKNAALPWSRPWTADGMASCVDRRRRSTACAWLRLTPGLSSNEMLCDANCPQWLHAVPAVVCSYRLKADSGTRWPLAMTYKRSRASGPCAYSGATSITTRYWLSAL